MPIKKCVKCHRLILFTQLAPEEPEVCADCEPPLIDEAYLAQCADDEQKAK